MAHPSDDELEAMAVTMADYCLHDVAAMLRACKGRVQVKALEGERARDGAGWHHQLTIAYCPVFEKRFYAERPEKQAKIEAARESRILAAFEPAPDARQEGWRAGMLDAAQVALDCICYDSAGIGFDEDKFDDAIRALAEKGPAPDQGEWNDAIEAAVNEIDCGCDGACMWPHACPKEDIEAIRNLKKGQTND